jgi:hypothetical protein
MHALSQATKPADQVSFFESIIIPLYEPIVRLSPHIHVILAYVLDNLRRWREILSKK